MPFSLRHLLLLVVITIGFMAAARGDTAPKPLADLNQLCTTMFAAINNGDAHQQIRFRLSSAEIGTASYAMLDRLVEFASDCPQTSIEVTGHTDDTGNAHSNQELSMRRARAVADYLLRHGVAERKLIVRGAGSSEPLADNATKLGRKKNRRIEFTLRLPPP